MVWSRGLCFQRATCETNEVSRSQAKTPAKLSRKSASLPSSSDWTTLHGPYARLGLPSTLLSRGLGFLLAPLLPGMLRSSVHKGPKTAHHPVALWAMTVPNNCTGSLHQVLLAHSVASKPRPLLRIVPGNSMSSVCYQERYRLLQPCLQMFIIILQRNATVVVVSCVRRHIITHRRFPSVVTPRGRNYKQMVRDIIDLTKNFGVTIMPTC